MKKIFATIGIAAGALALGGCQSLFGQGGQARADISDVDMGDYFAARLDAGRQHLLASRPAAAITAFRQASYDARYAGEAFNGMAIAYDRIGRPDLAARYFERAITAAPRDARFSRNLARLETRTPVVPMQQDERMADADLDIDAAVVAEARSVGEIAVPASAITVTRPETGLAQVGKGEVRVTRAAPDPASRQGMQPVRQAVINVNDRIAENSRMSFIRRNAQARRGYPIRVVLADRQENRQAYPIRIKLANPDD